MKSLWREILSSYNHFLLNLYSVKRIIYVSFWDSTNFKNMFLHANFFLFQVCIVMARNLLFVSGAQLDKYVMAVVEYNSLLPVLIYRCPLMMEDHLTRGFFRAFRLPSFKLFLVKRPLTRNFSFKSLKLKLGSHLD